MEKRAVRVSFELWKQMMTQGYSSGALRCVEGLPEDVEFLGSFCETETLPPDGKDGFRVRTEPVFVFGSDNWEHPPSGHIVAIAFGETLPTVVPIFRTAECRTCKYWSREAEFTEEGICSGEIAFVESDGTRWCILTLEDFGCTKYESRETDD